MNDLDLSITGSVETSRYIVYGLFLYLFLFLIFNLSFIPYRIPVFMKKKKRISILVFTSKKNDIN